jgi:MEMO1 family protein
VAGRFYPASREALIRNLDQFLKPEIPAEQKRSNIKACVVPHAGYMYSGHVAGAVYRSLPACPSYVILGPNHYGVGASLAITSDGSWATPLGNAPLDAVLCRALKRECEMIEEDAAAHEREHSLEVQLPFLQRGGEVFTFVPIAIGAVDYSQLESLGIAISDVIRSAERPIVIIASSDMNHYESDSVTRVKDRLAIDQVLALSPEGLFEVVDRERISMCGYAPVVSMLIAAKALGAREAVLERYATSADAGGDPSAVVGYAGIIIQ